MYLLVEDNSSKANGPFLSTNSIRDRVIAGRRFVQPTRGESKRISLEESLLSIRKRLNSASSLLSELN